MSIRYLSFLAGLAVLFAACEKSPVLNEPEPETETVKTYSREGVAPVTLSAGHETRTVLGKENYILWNEGDVISLIKEGDNSLRLLDASLIQDMAAGERKSILLVNPASNGCFLGFDGMKTVRYSEGLEWMPGGNGLNPDEVQTNLMIIRDLAETLRNDMNYIFTLERIDVNGWLLYHQATGIGISAQNGMFLGERYPCVMGDDLTMVEIQDGSANEGSSNLVCGSPEQIWIRNPFDGYFLWSGGSGNNEISWNPDYYTAWTSWLFYEIPETSYPFTADTDGASTTFTNKTGFSEGADTWYAFYPASANPCYSDDLISFFSPQVQSYRPGSFADGANVSVGILDENHLTFRSVFGILKLSLKGTQRVLSISVGDNAGMPLWGEGAVFVPSIKSEDCSAMVSYGSNTVTLDCGEGVTLQRFEATDFYIVVPAGAFSQGFKVEIMTDEGIFTKSTSKANTIARGDIKAMPAFNLTDNGQPIPEFNIQNEVVNAYMSKGPYSYFGATSYFNDSDVASLANYYGWSADRPAGLPISWDGTGAASITVAQNGAIWYTEDGITEGSYTLTNLTPGCVYSYIVEENGTILAEGEFKAVGQVRMVSISDSWNCRDLGGWTGLNGATIKYGKIFRTASLNGKFIGTEGNDYQNSMPDKYVFQPQSQEEIDRLGIKAELDLRGDPYVITGNWGRERYAHSVSLLQTKLADADFQRIMTDYGLQYPRNRSSLIQDVAWIIKELKLGKPVAFHCRLGADRTGAVAFVIESLLGVQEGDLARDYELTSLTSFDSNKRFASSAASGNYGIFKNNNGIYSMPMGETLQEKCYFYLNRFFSDVHIDADDLDWFICEMLGLDSYSHPSFARNYGMELDQIISISTGSGSYNL